MLTANVSYKVTTRIWNNFECVLKPGDTATLVELPDDELWALRNRDNQLRCGPAHLFEGWIADGTIVAEPK